MASGGAASTELKEERSESEDYSSDVYMCLYCLRPIKQEEEPVHKECLPNYTLCIRCLQNEKCGTCHYCAKCLMHEQVSICYYCSCETNGVPIHFSCLKEFPWCLRCMKRQKESTKYLCNDCEQENHEGLQKEHSICLCCLELIEQEEEPVHTKCLPNFPLCIRCQINKRSDPSNYCKYCLMYDEVHICYVCSYQTNGSPVHHSCLKRFSWCLRCLVQQRKHPKLLCIDCEETYDEDEQGGNTALINTSMKQLISSEIVDEWLKEGSVELTVTRVNMHGPPGAGKTCAQHLLLNEDPPSDLVTDSTPIARPTVRATRVSVDDENTKWEKVTRSGLLERLASDLTVKSKHIFETASATVLDSGVQQPDHPHVNESSDIKTVSIPNNCTSVPNESTAIPYDDTIVSHDKTSIPQDEIETETVIREILDTIQKSAVQLSGHWLYIIDSGGQPAYQELLPLFIRTASLNIITLDLSQPLDKTLDFQYRIGGKKFSCGLNLQYSNRDFFLSAVSSGAILKPINVPYAHETPSHPMHFVLGTHYDLIDEGALKRINKELMSSLNPDIQNYVVHNKRGESIVFPVNTLLSVPEGRDEAGQKLCQAVANCGGISLKIEMPIRWFAFELWLQKVATENKSHSFLQIDDVISAGKKFQMNKNDTKYALQYLHNVTIILYYPDVLPGLVFVDPQPILEILSRLLALTYVDRDALHLITNPVPLDEDINKLHNVGFFEEELLYHLKSDVDLFVAPHFEPSHLIKLLLHLHVIARGKEGDYFFPCALQSYTNLIVPPTETKPLLIVWHRQDKYEANTLPVPQGLFPLLITHLLNQEEVKFPPVRDNFYKYRDAMSLWVFVKGKCHTLHIINRYTHIEVYFDGSAKQAKENCPHIRKLITTAVKDSADAINVKHNYVNAFPCPSEKNCYCVVEEHYLVVNCTLCTRSPDICVSNESYWCWFDSGFEEINLEEEEAALDITDLDVVKTLLNDNKFSNAKWLDLGDALGLYSPTLDAIKADFKNVSMCFREVLVKWLEGADDVDKNGGARCSTLIKALEKCNQKRPAELIRCQILKRKAQSNDEPCSSKRIATFDD